MNELPRRCDYHGRDNEPCYGAINEYYDEKSEKWIDYCEGHQAVPRGGFYVPQDPMRRWIFSQQNSKIRKLEYENRKLWEAVRFADDKFKKLDIGEIELPAERLEILKHI